MAKGKKNELDIQKMIEDANGRVGLNNPNIPKMKNPPPPPPPPPSTSNDDKVDSNNKRQ